MFGVLGAVLGSSLAWAAPTDVVPPRRPLRESLQVEAGASCLEQERLVAVIEDALHTEEVDSRIEIQLVGDAEDPLSVEYTVQRDGKVIAVRRFDADATDCEQLHAVVGVSVALAIDATLLIPLPEPERTPEPEPEPEPEREPVDAERPPDLDPLQDVSPSPEPSPWVGAIVLRAGGGLRAPPEWAGVGAVAVELRWRERISIDAGVLGARGGFVDVGDGRAAFSLVGMTLDLCGGSTFGRVHPRGCVGFVGGGALAQGRGFASTRSDRLPWVAATFGADVRLRVAKRVELELGADGLVHILQPGFDFVDETGARQFGRDFPWFGAWLTAGVVVSFR